MAGTGGSVGRRGGGGGGGGGGSEHLILGFGCGEGLARRFSSSAAVADRSCGVGTW